MRWINIAAIILFGFNYSVLSPAQETTSSQQTITPQQSSLPKATPTPPLPDNPPPVAPNFEAPQRPLPSNQRVGVSVDNQMTLTLEQAIEFALQNSNDIDAARNDVEVAEFSLRSARGVYDPQIEAESYYESATTPTASLIGGAVNGSVVQKRIFGSAGFGGLSPRFGGSYSARFDNSRTTTSNTNAFLNPQFPTLLTFSYTQPLFRNLRFDSNRRSIEIAKKNVEISDAEFRRRAIETIAAVEQAYWDLVFALRNLQVQLDAVRQARDQLESNRRQVEKGILPPIDLVAATAQITTLEQNVYTAQENVTRAENALKVLMLSNRNSPEWNAQIVPVSPVSLDPPRVSLKEALDEALRSRPEVFQLKVSGELNKIDEKFYRDQTKPQIDLTTSYTLQGLAGTVTQNGTGRVPPDFIGGYQTSLGNLFSTNYPSYRVGVTISLPLTNKVAQANLGRTLAEGKKIENQREQLEQIIEADVRNALESLRSAEARLASAVAAREAAEKLFESEQRQFRAGTTTFYLVQQRQIELITARSRELQAQTDLNKAISAFHRAIGSTLSANNVKVSSGGNIYQVQTSRERARLFFRIPRSNSGGQN
ncbi:MAG TPA: TolC family protein [Pyrinomonadaceae bacterium]|jgi:HAE1 family hydrophobic/amphiphilic exporter-1|nr:TolC family protein [Pyrinomonadaceae bacterium]